MGRPPKVHDEASEALLDQYGFSELPETFAMRDGDQIIQERDACYICRADCFLGRGTHGTHYMEGSIVVTDDTPNIHMEPLNRAAGIKHAQWQRSLPNNRAPIDVGDMSEAAHMLAKNPEALNLDPIGWQNAVTKLASELKIKRGGTDAFNLPQMGHNFAPASGGNSPPILGAKMADMNQRGPGDTRNTVAVPAGPSGARRGAAILGGHPPTP